MLEIFEVNENNLFMETQKNPYQNASLAWLQKGTFSYRRPNDRYIKPAYYESI